MTTKDKAHEAIDRLPDDASMEQILYTLYVIDSVERGERQIDAGQGIAHEEVKRRLLARWQR